jgi:hypothetical protein
MEGFIKYALEVEDAHSFLHSWHKYSKYKKEMLSLDSLPINTEVKADIKLEGAIHVIVESRKKRDGVMDSPTAMGMMRDSQVSMLSATPIRTA